MQRILFFLFLLNSFLLYSNPIQKYTSIHSNQQDKIIERTRILDQIDSCFLRRPSDIDKGLELSSFFLSKYKKQNLISDTCIAHVMNVRANLFHMQNSFDSAIIYYNNARTIYDYYGIQTKYIAYFLYRPIGILYHKTGSFQEAIDILNQASFLLKKDNNTRLAAIYSEIGNVYQTTGNHSLSIKYYQKAMDTQDLAKWMQGILQENIGLSMLSLGKFSQAEIHLRKAFSLALETGDDIGVVSVLSVLGEMFYKTDHIEEAISYINLAIEKGKSIPGVEDRELAKIRYQLGKYLLESGHENQALSEFEQMLFLLQNETNSSVLDPWLMISHKSIAKCYDEKYETFKDTLFLNQAFKHYEISHHIADSLRKSYHSDISKLFLSDQTHDLYISAVENCYKLFRNNQDTLMLYKALQYSEFNKFQLLYEQMIQRIAFDTIKANRNIKDSINKLNISIAGIKKDIQILENNIQDFPLDSLHMLKSQLSLYHSKLKKQKDLLYVESGINHDYKNEIKPDVLEKFFKENPGKCLLEFLTTDTLFFVFYLDHNGLQLKRFITDPTNTRIQKLISQIQKRPDPTSNLSETVEMIETLNYVYDLLLKDYLNSTPKEIDHLIIIPDQYWSYLSFEALLTKNRSKDWFNHNDFLIQEYSFTYSGSIALYFHSNEKEIDYNENVYAGFAPDFNNYSASEISLRQLEYNKSEIESASRILGGETYLDSSAKLSQFKTQAKRNKIIHLATHSVYDSLVPMNSSLFFSDTSIRLYEIYQMNTVAQLVILNACNTGIGKHNTGEGVMSISNGFLESGSKACLMNLWSVDDYSTSQIVDHFISNLQGNNNMHESLQQAKITFLSTNRKLLHHPYYWASNILSSKIEQFNKNESISLQKKIWGISVLLLIVLMLFVRKKLRT